MYTYTRTHTHTLTHKHTHILRQYIEKVFVIFQNT